MSLKITADDIEDIAIGAALLGTGGGGDPYIGRLVAQSAIADYGLPEIIEVEDLADDAVVYSIAGFGAPIVQIEKLLVGEEVEFALCKLEQFLGKKADAILPAEIGGSNSMVPLMLGTRCRLPVINADSMGRAFPELQMNSPAANGIRPTPLVIVDEHMNYAVVDAKTNKRAEDLTRAIAIDMGLRVFIACFPMTGKDVKRFAVPRTLSAALGIGKSIREGRANGDPVASLIEFLQNGSDIYRHAKVLFDGKIVDLVRETARGFSVGSCTLADLNGGNSEAVVRFQNEFLTAIVDGKMVAMVPDLICVVDRETGEPIPTSGLKYGQRVKVLGTNAPAQLRTPQSLAVMGPQGFGMEQPFVPIEAL